MMAQMQSSRFGFTSLEVLLVIGILSGLLAIVAPSWRDYQIRSDLAIAAEQITQALGRAKLLAESGQGDSPWGFSVGEHTLFRGLSYALRDPSDDERYPVSPAVVLTGLQEVAFLKLTGRPTTTGSIILTSLRGERRIVTIDIDTQGIAVNFDDKLTICHCQSNPPHTMYVPESAWPAHKKHGDYFGVCHVPEDECD